MSLEPCRLPLPSPKNKDAMMGLLPGEKYVSITGTSCNIKGALCIKENSEIGVIVLHPWGAMGGNLHNNVVFHVTKSFLSSSSLNTTQNYSTLRINLPGSQIGRGMTEVDCVVTAANYLLKGDEGEEISFQSEKNNKQTRSISRPKKILLIGYSYGSLIAGSASALIPECLGVVYIGSPFSVQTFLLCFNSTHHLNQSCKRKDIPRLFLHGTLDNFTSVKNLQYYIKHYFTSDAQNEKTDVTVKILDGLDHFFFGNEILLVRSINEWCANKL